jgi:hypothetical protein
MAPAAAAPFDPDLVGCIVAKIKELAKEKPGSLVVGFVVVEGKPAQQILKAIIADNLV